MAEKTGSCGDNVRFSLTNDGKIKLTGTGAMYDYNDRDKFCPWYDERQEITFVEIDMGITYIGEYTFRCCRNLTKVLITSDVRTIGAYSFDHCVHLRTIIGMSGMRAIKRNAFEFCDLDDLHFESGLQEIGAEAFRFNSDLLRVAIPDTITSIGVGAFVGMQRDFELVSNSPVVVDYCKHNSCHWCKPGDEGKERH